VMLCSLIEAYQYFRGSCFSLSGGDELTNPDDDARKLVQKACILLHEYIATQLRRKQFS